MAVRRLLVLGFVLAMVALVSAHAAVATKAEPAEKIVEEQQRKDAVGESKVNPKTCPYGCGYWINGRCRICRPPGVGDATIDDEKGTTTVGVTTTAAGDAVRDDKHQCGARGCCGWFKGHCTHCCHAAEVAAGGGDAKAEAQPKN